MMENHHHMSPVYGSDLEFYSTNSTNVKSSNFVAGNNNNISSDAESGFSINVSTGKYNNFFNGQFLVWRIYFTEEISTLA